MWVAPDSRSSDEQLPSARSAAASSATTAPAPTDRTRTPPPLPIALRPFTAFDIVDGAIGVLKAAPLTVLSAAAVFVVPVELLVAWFDHGASGRSGIAGSFRLIASQVDDAGGARGLDAWLLLGLVSLSLTFLAGALGFLVASWYGGRNPTIAETVLAPLHRGPTLVVAWCGVHAVEAVLGLAGGLPGLLVMPLFALTAPAIVVEDLGPFAGIRRSWRLSLSRFGSAVGVIVLIALVDVVLTVALSPIGALLGAAGAGMAADLLCTAAASMVTMSFVAAATTLLYLDRRVRAEGLDLELGITEHFRAP